jgi:AraC-like DNA-binding protein
MKNFYYKALLVSLGLLVMCSLVGFFCFKRSYVGLRLLPAASSVLPWRSAIVNDAGLGGESSVAIRDDKFSLGFDFSISNKIEYPRIAIQIEFIDSMEKPLYLDLSSYDTISFSIKCHPANTLYVGIMTFDDKVSVVGDDSTHRSPETYFSCDESWKHQEVDLTRLVVPEWWLYKVNQDISRRGYSLRKVLKLGFGSSSQSPINTASYVQVNDLVLSGRNWGPLYLFGCATIVVWAIYFYWFFKQFKIAASDELTNNVQRNLSVIDYKQLSVEPYKDKEKNVVISYITTEYANPELDYEKLAAAVGMGKTKINEILKAELGCTFSVYLNKLRLTEAARLLSQQEFTIAEIAYSVGYKNISYFNKLFKEEYGCTPKEFKNIRKS